MGHTTWGLLLEEANLGACVSSVVGKRPARMHALLQIYSTPFGGVVISRKNRVMTEILRLQHARGLLASVRVLQLWSRNRSSHFIDMRVVLCNSWF